MSYADIINAHSVWGYKWSEPGRCAAIST